MSRVCAVVVALSASERKQLKKRARSPTTPFRDVERARIVLMASAGLANAVIGRKLGITDDTVRKWRGRFARRGLDGLGDLARSGRPRIFTDVHIAGIKALACQLPAEHDVPLSLWTCADLAAEAIAAGVVQSVSASSVHRWLVAAAIKPWQYRSWINIRDPDFEVKARRVLDLYQRRWKNKPLGKGEYVISSDEKTSIQARCRCHPTLPPGKARAMRIEHEYDRKGALAYLAALDVGSGRVIGQCAEATGIIPFMALVEAVMTSEPYASARRVFWIVDNGSSHNGQASIDRLAKKYPNAVMVHTPIHASWLNQIEIYFSIIQRKVVRPNDFTDLDQIRQRLAQFEIRYNATARPFDWKFTKTDLAELLERIERHQIDQTENSQQAA